MSTLLYLASGDYNPKYEDLNFDEIILIDKSSRLGANIPKNSKVKLITMDALAAIRVLKKRRKNIKIDCLVSVNEGLFEGGGDYPMFSDFLLGYLSPILSDELLVITDIAYYNAANIGKRVAKMDWGFESSKVSRNDPKFIDPKVFTTFSNTSKSDYGNVFLLKRNKRQQPLSLNPQLDIKLVHGSIWEDEDQLDLIGLKLKPRQRSRKVDDFFQGLDVYDLTSKSIEEILKDAEDKKVKHFGLTPWMNGDYEHVMDVLKNYIPTHLEKISFYHLRKKDYDKMCQQVNQVDMGI